MWILAARKGCKSPLYPTNSLWESFYTLFISPPLNFLSPLNIKKKKNTLGKRPVYHSAYIKQTSRTYSRCKKIPLSCLSLDCAEPMLWDHSVNQSFYYHMQCVMACGCWQRAVWWNEGVISVIFLSAHLKIITDALLQIHLHCWNQSLPHVTSCLTFKHRRACILKLLHLFTASHDSREAIKHVSWLITLLQSCHSLGGTCRSLQPRWVLSDCWVTSGVLV